MNTILVVRDEDEPDYFKAHVDAPGALACSVKLEAHRPHAAAEEARKYMGLSDEHLDWQGEQWDIQVPELDVPRHLRPETKLVVA